MAVVVVMSNVYADVVSPDGRHASRVLAGSRA